MNNPLQDIQINELWPGDDMIKMGKLGALGALLYGGYAGAMGALGTGTSTGAATTGGFTGTAAGSPGFTGTATGSPGLAASAPASAGLGTAGQPAASNMGNYFQGANLALGLLGSRNRQQGMTPMPMSQMPQQPRQPARFAANSPYARMLAMRGLMPPNQY
jgi:hypothetical protein